MNAGIFQKKTAKHTHAKLNCKIHCVLKLCQLICVSNPLELFLSVFTFRAASGFNKSAQNNSARPLAIKYISKDFGMSPETR